MGTLRSQQNLSGRVYEGVTLGDPVAPIRNDGTHAQPGDSMADLFFAWNHETFPTGVAEIVDDSLYIVIDEPTAIIDEPTV